MGSNNQQIAASLIDVKGLSAALAAFAAERNWDQFHSPKNLSMALTGEVGQPFEMPAVQ